MSFTQFEEDIVEILNEDTLSDGLVRRKIQMALRRIESLWDFPYMFHQGTIVVPAGNAPVSYYTTEWKLIKKIGLWSADAVDTSLMTYGQGATGFEGFLQKINMDDLKNDHFETLNVTTSWGQPLMYQIQAAGFTQHPITATRIFRTAIQLYPPSDVERKITLMGYRYSPRYTDNNEGDDHWMLLYGRELMEAWTMLSLTPALQDASLAKFYEGLVASAQEILLKSEANADWEGLDETAEYLGEGDI